MLEYYLKLLTIVMFIAVTSVFASMNTHDEDIIIYQQKSTNKNIQITGDALYLRPQNIAPGSIELETEFDWGYQLQFRRENHRSRSLYVQIQHYKSVKQNLNKQADDFESEGSVLFPYDYLSRFDIVNVQMSQSLYLMNQLDLRIHGGFEYAKLESDYAYALLSTLETTLLIREELNQYTGVGGVIGLDMKYHLNDKWSIFFNNNWQLISQHTSKFIHVIEASQFITAESQFNNTDKGSLLGAYALSGLHYEKGMLNGVLSLELGWFALLFNDNNLLWSGGAFGLKWRENL